MALAAPHSPAATPVADRPMALIPAAFWIAVFSFREMARRRRLIFLSLVLLAPVLATLLWRTLDGGEQVAADLLMANLGGLLYVHLLVAIVSLAVGISAISEQIDEGTILYYWTRPLSRSAIYLGRLLAAQMVAAVLLVFSLAICFLVVVVGNFGVLSLDFLKGYLGHCTIVVIGAFVYTSLFALLGTALRKPMLPAVLFGIGWEYLGGYVVPLKLQMLTIVFHLRNLIRSSAEGTRDVPNLVMQLKQAFFQEEVVPEWRSALTLLVITCVTTLLGIWLLRNKEIFK